MWKLFAVATLVGVVVTLATQFSLVIVHNDSTADLSGIEIRSEAFDIRIAHIRAGESRWFVRPAAASCGLAVRAMSKGRSINGGAGFMLSSRHGYVVSVSIHAAGVRARSFPDALLNTSR
jgi:hypothetical protein